MVEIIVNGQFHTPYSDGAQLHEQVAEEATRSGHSVDVVIGTDHNVRPFGMEGYHHGVLVLTGEEVHNRRLPSDANHCLIYNCPVEMASLAHHPQHMLDEVRQHGGLAFIAHPFHHEPGSFSDKQALSWTQWNLQNITGMEIWNHQTETTARLRDPVIRGLAKLFPSLVIHSPFRATLRKWDELTASGKCIVAIGNADAHGLGTEHGSRKLAVFSYEHAFRCINTHVLIPDVLTRNPEQDKDMVYGALAAGHAFVAYDLSHAARGFTFSGSSGAEQVIMGDTLHRRGVVHLAVECPASGSIRLLRNGKVIKSKHGRTLKHITTDTGVYRIEVYRPFRLLNRGWIFSNPIYVT